VEPSCGREHGAPPVPVDEFGNLRGEGVGTCNGTVSYVKAVSTRSGRVPVGVVSVHSGSGAARV
jgi:hypothetical protein